MSFTQNLESFAGLPGGAASLGSQDAWPAGLAAPTGPQAQDGSGTSSVFAGLPLAPPDMSVDAGGPIKPVPPSCLGDVLKKPSAPAGLADFINELGADSDTTITSFCCLSEEDMSGALNNTLLGGDPLSPMQRAEVVRATRAIFVDAGFEAPALGGVLPKALAPPAQAPAPPQQPAQSVQSPPEIANSETVVALSEVIDQAARGTAKPLTYAELAVYRSRYIEQAGCAPPDETTPTSEQLAALRALLQSGRVPFADFAVWSPYGSRLARFRKTDAAVFIGNALVQKRVEGPTTFEAWCSSWDLFTVAMVSLGAAKLGAMMKYRAGLVQLTRLFPRFWGVLQTTDILVRTERWSKLREQLETFAAMGAAPPGFVATAPWDTVISQSAYGADTLNAGWWRSHFELPCTLASTPGGATQMIHTVEGYPGAAPPTSSAGSSAGSGAQNQTQQPPAKKAKVAADPSEVCSNYNTRAGRCAGDAPCVNQRRHVCDVCGEKHRRVDFHPPSGAGKRDWNRVGAGWQNKKGGGKKQR